MIPITSPTFNSFGCLKNCRSSVVRVYVIGPLMRLNVTREAVGYDSARNGVGGDEAVWVLTVLELGEMRGCGEVIDVGDVGLVILLGGLSFLSGVMTFSMLTLVVEVVEPLVIQKVDSNPRLKARRGER